MASYLVVSGVKPYDGSYELDLENSELTRREWGWIKRYAGYLPMTVSEGFDGADPDLVACLAIIALHRAEKIETDDIPRVWDRFADAPALSSIRMEGETDETQRADDPPASSSGNGSTSGHGSPTSSESSTDSPSDAGTPASDSSESTPAWSAS